MGKQKRRPPVLKVVFDTNVLHTKNAEYLVNLETTDLIEANSAHPDLTVNWCIPEVVRHEREFQMRKRARDFLPSVQNLEKLLGHKLNITEEILNERVAQAIERNVRKLNLAVVSLDPSGVDWSALVRRSAFRELPFEDGEREKGFRDAIILEIFSQIVSSSPTTPNICRIALVSSDAALRGAAESRMEGQTNTRILGSLDELKSLINTLVSSITEEFVNRHAAKAKEMFFSSSDNKDSIYYKEDIAAKIQEQFSEVISKSPVGATSTEISKWWISPPAFIRKVNQRIFWGSRITLDVKSYKVVQRGAPSPSLATAESGGANPPSSGLGGLLSSYLEPGGLLGGIPSTKNEKVLVSEGKIIFVVNWSTSVTQNEKLTNARVEGISHAETTWGQ